MTTSARSTGGDDAGPIIVGHLVVAGVSHPLTNIVPIPGTQRLTITGLAPLPILRDRVRNYILVRGADREPVEGATSAPALTISVQLAYHR